jgi:hypothetical protein
MITGNLGADPAAETDAPQGTGPVDTSVMSGTACQMITLREYSLTFSSQIRPTSNLALQLSKGQRGRPGEQGASADLPASGVGTLRFGT